MVEDGGGHGVLEVVREVDLASMGVVGGDAMGDDVVYGFEIEVGIPCFEKSVHSRADNIIGDSVLAGPVLAVVVFVSHGVVLQAEALVGPESVEVCIRFGDVDEARRRVAFH